MSQNLLSHCNLQYRRGSYTCDHDPGAYPRSTTVCPGLNKRYLSLICSNLNAALLLRPWTRASRAKRSLDWRSTHRLDDANRRQMTLLTGLGVIDARLNRAPHDFEPLRLSMTSATIFLEGPEASRFSAMISGTFLKRGRGN